MQGSIRCLDHDKPVRLKLCTCRGESRKEMRVLVKDPATGKMREKNRTIVAGKRDAQKSLIDFVAELTSDEARPMSTTSTLGELMDRWLQHVEARERGKGTLKNYRWHSKAVRLPLAEVLAKAGVSALEVAFERADVDELVDRVATAEQRRRFVNLFFDEQQYGRRRPWCRGDFVLGDLSLRDLTDDHIEAYYDALSWIRREARTVNGYHASIRAALNYGLQKKWIAGNPAIGTARPPIRDAKITVPTPAQVRHLIIAATERRAEWGAFLRVAAGTWARRGELVALRADDVNLDRNEVTIATSMSAHQGLKDTKTHASRRLRIDADTADAIRDQLTLLRKRAAELGVELVENPFLFSDAADGSVPWHPDTPSDFFDRVREAVGATGVRLHDLRHFGATQAISAGMPITAVSRRLGHSKVTTTLNIYAHWLPADDDDLAELMSGLLSPKADLRLVR